MNDEGSNEGWIKVHRNITKHWIFEDPVMFKWWIDLICMANHKDRKILVNKAPFLVKRGCHHTSIRKLSERWNVSRRRTERFLKMLQDEAMINIKKAENGTTLEIRNYERYQSFSECQRATDDTTHVATDDTTHVATHDTRDRPQTRIKELKKEKKEKINRLF